MNEQVFQTAMFSLLNDLSRIIQRAENVRKAKADEILGGLMNNNSVLSAKQDDVLQGICQLASEMSSQKEIGGNTGEASKNDSLTGLYSIFNRLNTEKSAVTSQSVLCYDEESGAFFRCDNNDVATIDYRKKTDRISERIRKFSGNDSEIGQCLDLIYEYCSDVPYVSGKNMKCDLSVYEHARLTAAFAGALTLYSRDKNSKSVDEIRNSDSLLLYTADFSGIQNFIYTVVSENALKTLRAKSFFVELVMANLTDEITESFGLTKANLLYSGGGHCYMILPNMTDSLKKLDKIHRKLNDWSIRSFGSSLSVLWETKECSPSDFMEEKAYKGIFTGLSSKIAKKKFRKYMPADLIALNRPGSCGDKTRECSICGRASAYVRSGGDHCDWCAAFLEMARTITDADKCFAVLKTKKHEKNTEFFTSEGTAYLAFLSGEECNEEAEKDNVIRIYCKNRYISDEIAKSDSSRIIAVCDYAKDKMMDDLVEYAKGVKRLGVLRMDVDNLGNTFISGFGNNVSIARTAALSTQLSVFFKCRLADILSRENYNITVLYAGGDDVFLVGSWNDVISAADRIICEFEELTDGKLTISGGIGIYNHKYPVARYAAETEKLESCSKHNTKHEKDSITLFADDGSNTYSWKEFREEVIGEKLKALEEFIGSDDSDKGNSFLYKLLEYIRGCESDRINIARAAYLLGRMCSKNGVVNQENAKAFSDRMFGWIGNEKDRKQLATAICIFVYQERKCR